MGYKRQFSLQGFITKEQALQRSHELAIAAGMTEQSATRYLVSATQVGINNWALIVNEEYAHLLTEQEKSSVYFHEVAKPQAFINFYNPTLYRYLPKKYVDEFFEEGKIRLSSFAKFKELKDEQKGDSNEGNSVLWGISEEQSVMAVTSHGHDAFVLCGSLILNKEVMADFQADDCIVISDPAKFAMSIANCIPEIRGILLGPCRYQKDKTLQRRMGNFRIEDLRVSSNDQSIDMNKIFQLSSQVGGDNVFFTKVEKYAPQHEFRFLWFTWDSIASSDIYIVCPEATKFCRRLSNLDLIDE